MLTRDGDGFRANGFKDFSTGASVADAILMVVKLAWVRSERSARTPARLKVDRRARSIGAESI